MRFIRFRKGDQPPRFGWILNDPTGLMVGPIDGSPLDEFRRQEADLPLERVQLLPPIHPRQNNLCWTQLRRPCQRTRRRSARSSAALSETAIFGDRSWRSDRPAAAIAAGGARSRAGGCDWQTRPLDRSRRSLQIHPRLYRR